VTTVDQRSVLALVLLALVVAVAMYFAAPHAVGGFATYLDPDTWREWRAWIRGFGVLAPLVTISISVLQIVPLPVPPPTVPLVNGWLFGPAAGTLVTWIGIMLNALLGYKLASGPARDFIMRFLPGDKVDRAEELLEEHGSWAVLLLRMVPVLPFTAVSVGAGLFRLSFREYCLASALGILPSAFALSLIGYQLSRGALDWMQVGIAVGILVGLALVGIPLARWFSSDTDD
jgi:uncharacterized membrane protein YdjX (TVP38/TMEM64 family)